MNIFNKRILSYWISFIVVFITSLILIIASPDLARWGLILSIIYWIGYMVVYTRQYKGLRGAVKERFPDVYKLVFSDESGLKNKFPKLEYWKSDPRTTDMYYYDINIKNRYLKIKLLDKFSYIVFGLTILLMIITLILIST